MKLSFTFKHMESSDELKLYAEKKSEKLKKLVQHPIDLHYIFSADHGKYRAELTMLADHNKYVANAEEDLGTKAVDLATERMMAQLRKHKGKVQAH